MLPSTSPLNTAAIMNDKLQEVFAQVKIVADNIDGITEIVSVVENLNEIQANLAQLLNLNNYTTTEVLNNLISSMSEMLVFETKQDLINSGNPGSNGIQARVFGDPVPAENNVYVYNDGWTPDSNYLQAQITFLEDKLGLTGDIAGKIAIGRVDNAGLEFIQMTEYSGSILPLTASLIQSMYESNASTERFTPAYRSQIDANREAVAQGGLVARQTLAEIETHSQSALVDNTPYLVTNDPDGANNNGRYLSLASGAVIKAADDNFTLLSDQLSSKVDNSFLFSKSKNLVNPAKIRKGFYVSPGAGQIIASSDFRCTDFIPVTVGDTISTSGSDAPLVGLFSAADDNAYINSAATVFVVPTGVSHIVYNVTNSGEDNLAFDNVVQVEVSPAPTAYQPWGYDFNRIDRTIFDEDVTFDDEIFDEQSFNLLDESQVDYTNRYSTGSMSFNVDTIGIAASPAIDVIEGETYIISGAYFGQGGYFNSEGVAVANVIYADPPAGEGKVFQVPFGQGIVKVVHSLRKLNSDADSTTLSTTVQVELGEVATEYRPYEIVRMLLPEYRNSSNSTASSAALSANDWYTFLQSDGVENQLDKLPIFYEKMMGKNSDLVVVNTGTSLTARSGEHSTAHPEASFRPPLMHSNNWASLLWDRMKWRKQEYRRYDADSYFNEAGTFSTTFNIPEWDDGLYRQGWTRYSDIDNSSVSFDVPVDAWQFNWIYRTDALGTDCTIDIGSDGLMEVYDEASNQWLEANDYAFTMRETAPVLSNISVPRASTQEMVTQNIQTKANTTYQKRLKMRCSEIGGFDSRSQVKTVTINGGAGRFMYWGVEWSPRQYMITYINAARGSHNTQADTARGLPKYADNEVWGFKPNLILMELPTHNDGAGGDGTYSSDDRWAHLVDNFVYKADYDLSMVSRSTLLNGYVPEIAMITASIAVNFGGIGDDGSLNVSQQGDGEVMDALDKYNESALWVRKNHPETVFINAAQRWVTAGEEIFGDLRLATLGSGRDGVTFTNEGSHWNDTGSKIMAKPVIASVFNFI